MPVLPRDQDELEQRLVGLLYEVRSGLVDLDSGRRGYIRQMLTSLVSDIDQWARPSAPKA